MKRQLTATAVAGAAALAGSLLGSAPAQAATCTLVGASVDCPTTVTFTITAGALSITVPDSATLTVQTPSGSPTTWWAFGTVGPVTVNDLRAVDPANWTVTVTSTAFTHDGGSPAIPASDVYYCSGNATSTSPPGDTGFTPGQPGPCDPPPPPDGVPLDTAQPAFSHTGGSGTNSAGWNPSLSVQIPLTAVAGTYTGTITHTLA